MKGLQCDTCNGSGAETVMEVFVIECSSCKGKGTVTWKLSSHSSAIADTGDYNSQYELTNGELTLITNQDDLDDELGKIVQLLNRDQINFYVNDMEVINLELKNRQLQHEIKLLKEERNQFLNQLTVDDTSRENASAS